MYLYGFVTGEIEGVERSVSPDLKAKYSTLRRDHRQTLDLLETQDGVIGELRANLLTAATLAVQFAGQLERVGQVPDCEPEALALADSIVQEQQDCLCGERCGSACNADEGE